MSFSSDIKKQICACDCECSDCTLAELSGIVEFSGSRKEDTLRFSTENDDIAERICDDLLNALGISVSAQRGEKGTKITVCGEDNINRIQNEINIFGDTDKNPNSGGNIKECCLRSYVRGCFIGGGSINDPQKSYHLEFDTKNPAGIDHLKLSLTRLGYDAKITYRKGHYLVYVKESDAIAEILGLMGAGIGAMELYTVQVEKEMRNSMNRRVNCETANIDKAMTASAMHIAAIKRIIDGGGFEALPETLYEMARVRMENPEDSLKELSDKIGIGKSGVNHRLKRLMEIAEEY